MARDVRSLGYGDLAQRPRLKAIGIGGAGCNAIANSPFPSVGLCSHLDNVNGPPNQRRLVLSPEEMSLFASATPQLIGGVERSISKRLREEIEGYDLVFLFAGLGGETGSRVIPGLANLCRRLSGMVVASVTMPFSAEGPGRRGTAAAALPRLIDAAHLTITYPNDGLLKVAPNLPFRRTFKVMDGIMTVPPQELAGVLTRNDLRVLKSELGAGRHMRMGAGAGLGLQRESVAVSEAFDSPWFDFDLSGTTVALVVVSGREVDEYSLRDILGHVQARVPNAMVRYGVRSDPAAEDLRVTVLLDTGT